MHRPQRYHTILANLRDSCGDQISQLRWLLVFHRTPSKGLWLNWYPLGHEVRFLEQLLWRRVMSPTTCGTSSSSCSDKRSKFMIRPNRSALGCLRTHDLSSFIEFFTFGRGIFWTSVFLLHCADSSDCQRHGFSPTTAIAFISSPGRLCPYLFS